MLERKRGMAARTGVWWYWMASHVQNLGFICEREKEADVSGSCICAHVLAPLEHQSCELSRCPGTWMTGRMRAGGQCHAPYVILVRARESYTQAESEPDLPSFLNCNLL